MACGCEAIDLPDHGWQHQQVARALRRVADVALWDSSNPRGEVQLVYIEQPWLAPRSGTKSAYSAGRAVQAVQAEVERRWPHAPIEYVQPSEWRKLAGVSQKGKEAVVLRALDLGFGVEVMHDQSCVLSWEIPGGQDAADAACIAYAGWVRNEDTVARAAARDEAA